MVEVLHCVGRVHVSSGRHAPVSEVAREVRVPRIRDESCAFEYGSHTLAAGAGVATTVATLATGVVYTESVDTATVVAGFGGGHRAGRPPRPRTATPAALR